MQLDVESLRTFLAVLDHGSMTKAATQLQVSQSAVSWKIKRLEARVGRALLIREGRNLRASRDGRALIDDARAIIELHDRAVSRLQSSELTGTVRLGTNEEVGASRIAAALGRFRLMHPGATVEFVVDSSEALTLALDRGRLDVAVIQVNDERFRPDDVVLWTDELRWITHRECRFDSGTVPLITFGKDCFYRPVSEPLLTANGIEYTAAISVPSSIGIVSAVEAGLGVAVLGSRFLQGDIVEWERGAALERMPCVHQIARTAAGEHPVVAAALVAAIEAELSEHGQRSQEAA